MTFRVDETKQDAKAYLENPVYPIKYYRPRYILGNENGRKNKVGLIKINNVKFLKVYTSGYSTCLTPGPCTGLSRYYCTKNVTSFS